MSYSRDSRFHDTNLMHQLPDKEKWQSGVTLLQGSSPKAGAVLGGGYQAPVAPAEMGCAQTLRVPP